MGLDGQGTPVPSMRAAQTHLWMFSVLELVPPFLFIVFFPFFSGHPKESRGYFGRSLLNLHPAKHPQAVVALASKPWFGPMTWKPSQTSEPSQTSPWQSGLSADDFTGSELLVSLVATFLVEVPVNAF